MNKLRGFLAAALLLTASAPQAGAMAWVPPPTISFSATINPVAAGGFSTLKWSTSGATSVQLDPSVGEQPLSGSLDVSPTQTTTYTLTATGPGGSATQQVTIEVVARTTSCPNLQINAINQSSSAVKVHFWGVYIGGTYDRTVWPGQTLTFTSTVRPDPLSGQYDIGGEADVSPFTYGNYRDLAVTLPVVNGCPKPGVAAEFTVTANEGGFPEINATFVAK